MAIQGWSNPNLLDNWYFADPINQRGKTEYRGIIGYTIDRWSSSNSEGIAILHNGYLELQHEGEGSGWLRQDFENELSNDYFTFSILFKDNMYNSITYIPGTDPGALLGNIYNNALQIFGNKNFISIGIKLTSSVPIVAVKLERGKQQTLVRQDENGNYVLNDPPPNKALELAKCQRYFYPVLIGGRDTTLQVFRGAAENELIHVVEGISMRTYPVVYNSLNSMRLIVYPGTYQFQDNIQVSIYVTGTERAALFFNSESFANSGHWADAHYMEIDGFYSSGGLLALSAEL